MQSARGAFAGAGAGAGAGPESGSVQVSQAPPAVNRWREVVCTRNKKPPCRSGAASVICGDNLYLFGGYGGEEGRLDDFWEFCFGERERGR